MAQTLLGPLHWSTIIFYHQFTAIYFLFFFLLFFRHRPKPTLHIRCVYQFQRSWHPLLFCWSSLLSSPPEGHFCLQGWPQTTERRIHFPTASTGNLPFTPFYNCLFKKLCFLNLVLRRNGRYSFSQTTIKPPCFPHFLWCRSISCKTSEWGIQEWLCFTQIKIQKRSRQGSWMAVGYDGFGQFSWLGC